MAAMCGVGRVDRERTKGIGRRVSVSRLDERHTRAWYQVGRLLSPTPDLERARAVTRDGSRDTL